MAFIIVGILILGFGLYLINIYNYFQVAKTRVAAATQEIANQLKRQANLIPNLIESTKGYLKHEKGIFDQLSAARQAVMSGLNNSDPKKIAQASTVVDKIMPQLLAIVESNPEIKADGVVTKLMDELRDTGDKTMYARRSLIDLSADYNAKRLTFPSKFIADAFGFEALPGLSFEGDSSKITSVTEAETQEVKVSL